jgi:hypothetical protein
MKENARVREIIIPLLQYDIYVSLAEPTTGEKTNKKPANKSNIKKQLLKKVIKHNN